MNVSFCRGNIVLFHDKFLNSHDEKFSLRNEFRTTRGFITLKTIHARINYDGGTDFR